MSNDDLNFTPYMTKQEALDFGGNILSDNNVYMRVAGMILAQSRDDLLKSFGSDLNLLADTIENLSDTKPFLEELLKMNEMAVARLAAISYTLVPEEKEVQHA